MDTEELHPELMKKAVDCKTPEELIALEKEEGEELTGEQVESLSGKKGWYECNTLSPCGPIEDKS